jgi:FkbM family methyltransferase
VQGIPSFLKSLLKPDQWFTQAVVKAYGRARGVAVRFEGNTISFERGKERIRIASSNFPFAQDMIVHFDSFYKVVRPDANGEVDYSRPRVHRYMKSGIEFHLPSIAEEEEAIDSYFRLYRPKAGDVVFDLGAHAGVSTYFLAQAVGPTGKVFAFEPDPISWKSLMHNIEALQMRNVHPVQKAIAGKAGKLSFQSEASLGSALSNVASRAGTGTTTMVDAITLADACELAGCLPAFVKMDIEGAELEVIAAAQAMLRGSCVQFAADTNHNVGGQLTNQRLERLFSEIGFECMSSADSGFMTTWASAPSSSV